MKHLLYLRDLNKDLIDELLESAEYFLSKKNNVSMTEQILQGIDLANIFFLYIARVVDLRVIFYMECVIKRAKIEWPCDD